MKKILLTLAMGILGLSTASANPALLGHWTISDRYCTDGSAAVDAFVLGRDQLELQILQNTIQTMYVIPGHQHQGEAPYTADNKYMYDSNSGEASPYVISANDELMLITAGFGQGGTCPEGQALLLKFIRK